MADTILIVEDDVVFRRVLSFAVGKTGMTVETAGNGEVGFERLMRGGIDFLVTDLQMPLCSGIELLTRLQAIKGYQRPPTILCTAKGRELDTQTLKVQFALAAILHKPFSPRKLSNLVLENLCGVRSASPGPAPAISAPAVSAPAISAPAVSAPILTPAAAHQLAPGISTSECGHG